MKHKSLKFGFVASPHFNLIPGIVKKNVLFKLSFVVSSDIIMIFILFLFFSALDLNMLVVFCCSKGILFVIYVTVPSYRV